MIGAFTRLNYDDPAYDEQMCRVTYPMTYKLDNKCVKAMHPEQINIDTKLKGIDKHSTKSNRVHKQEKLPNINYTHPEYSNIESSEYTRHSFPRKDIRGIDNKIRNFDYPLYDPQCQIFENFEVNTRLAAKDNHKAIWMTPMDQDIFLPNRNFSLDKKLKK